MRLVSVEEINNAEATLQKAMIESDLEVLNELISDDLVFIVANGAVVRKEDDLNVHRQHLQIIHSIESSEQTISINSDVAAVTVKKNIDCTFFGERQKATFRYLRVWRKTQDKLQIISGSMTPIL